MTETIMRALSLIAMFVAACLAFCPYAARAQTETNEHTFASISGTDNDSCGSVTTPCKTIQYGIYKTLAGGEVECLGPVVGAGLTISKSITVSCDPARGSNWLATNTWYESTAINVTATDVVILRGLRLSEVPNSSGNGFIFSGAGTLVIDNVEATGFGVNGILFQPTGPARLVVSNSLFARNGDFTGNTGAGIRVVPRSGGSAQVVLDHVSFHRNVFGAAIDGSSSSGAINATITDSISTTNAQDGVVATSANGPISVTVGNSKLLNNGIGIRSTGGNVTVRVKNSEIVGNVTGVGGGGVLLSAGDNTVQANGTNGNFSGTYAKQ